MRKILDKTFILLLISLLLCPFLFSFGRAEIDSREALRALYAEKTGLFSGEIYLETPNVQGEYRAGALTREALEAALGEVNFVRALAGVGEVSLRDDLNELCQYGAVLLAANGALSHAPEQPQDMDDAFYAQGQSAAAQCNLARFNWMESDILRLAVQNFARDEGERNELVLGHRRWLLYPNMQVVGFGLANGAGGETYALMYVMDDAAQADYDLICWPGEGYFPAEYLTKDTFWSVSPNPDRYDLQGSSVVVRLEELVSGACFEFDFSGECSDCALAGGRYGDGPAYVFRPDLSGAAGISNGYEQNQMWQVTLSGLKAWEGGAEEKVYQVVMASLTPIDPAMVEFDEQEITLAEGEARDVSARVVPSWADDTRLFWSVEDERVASVDQAGRVTALAPGRTRLIARAVNGREDSIPLVVRAG